MQKTKKYVVVLLALLLARQWIVDPYLAQVENWEDDMASLAEAISRAKDLVEQKQALDEFSHRVVLADRENKTWFITVADDQTAGLSNLQKQFNRLLSDIGFDVGSITLGEPVTVDDPPYTRLSLAFNATTDPSGVRRFLLKLNEQKPLVLLEAMTVQSRRDKLLVSGQVSAFWIAGEVNDGAGEGGDVKGVDTVRSGS